MLDSLINTVLFSYIVSIYIFTYRAGLYVYSNMIAVLFVFFVVLRIYVMEKKIKFNIFLLLFLFFIFVCGVSYFVAVDKSLVVIQLRGLFLNFILLWSLINYIDDYDKLDKLIRYFVYSGVIASLYILLSSDITQYTRLGSILGNVNAIGVIIGISFIFSIYLVIYEKKYINIFYGFLMLPTIILTGSRKAILIVMVSMLIIIYLKYRKSLIKKIKFIILSIIIVLIFYYLVFNIPIFHSILGRRFENMFNFLGEVGTNEGSILIRNYMVKFGLEMLASRPILGYGINNYRVLLENSIGVRKYAHNNYIELLVGTGIIGTAIFYSMYLHALIVLRKKFLKHINLSYLFFSLNLTILVMGYTFVHFHNKHLLIILAISSVTIKPES